MSRACILVHCLLLFCQSAELVSLRQDMERQKELDTAQELKTKWYLNQLNIETEAHKVRNNDYHQPLTTFVVQVEQLIHSVCVWVCVHVHQDSNVQTK